MKTKILSFLIVLSIGVSSCTHVSPTSMTMLGSDVEDVTYQTSGGSVDGKMAPAVVFHASKLNNSVSFGRVTDLGGSLITWWGIGQVARAAGKAYNNYNQEQTAQQAAKINGVNKALEIKSNETITLGRQALEAAKP